MAIKELSLGIVLGAVVSSSFRSSFDTSRKSIAQLKTKIYELNSQKLKLKSSDMTTEAMSKLKSIRREIANLKKEAIIKLKLDGIKESIAEQKNGLIAIGATAYGLAQPLQSRADVEKSQGQLSSLNVSETGIGNVTKAAEEYVKRYAGTTVPEFIAASYDLKSGIASLTDDSLATFATLSAKTASATKASTSTMNKVVALGHGIFRSQFQSDEDFIVKFTAASSRAVQAFRTDGEDLALGLSNVGASAASMGVKLEEQLAILGVAKSSFNSMAEAGTGYRAFLSNVGKAQKDLGLTFVDSQGHMLPMINILGKIKNKYGDLSKLENSDDLKSAFGSDEAVKFIKGLIDRQDELVQSQKDINREMKNGTKLVDEMSGAMQRGQGFTLMSQNIGILSSKIGRIFMPAATLLAKVIGKTADGIGWLIDTFPRVSGVIGGAVMAFFGLAAVMKIATLWQLLFKFAAVSLRGVMLKNIVFTKLWAGAQWLLNKAMSANPIGLIVLGVTALIGLGVVLYNNFKPFADMMNGIGNTIGKFFGFNPEFGKSNSKINSTSNPLNITAPMIKKQIPSIPPGAGRNGSQSNTTHHTQNTFNITGSDPKAVGDEIIRRMEKQNRDRQDRSMKDRS